MYFGYKHVENGPNCSHELTTFLKYHIPGESIGLKFIPSQTELFRFISISVSEPMQIIPKQSEKRFVSHLMKNGRKSIWLNSINSETSIWMNPNESEAIWNQYLNPDQSDLGFIQTEFSIRINPNESKVGMIRIDLDWNFGFGLDRIHSDWCLGINRIKADWFLTVIHQTRYKTFFGLVRNDSHWLGYRYRNESE